MRVRLGLRLLLIASVVVLAIGNSAIVFAASSQSVSISATPNVGQVLAPSNFILTRLDSNYVSASWTKGVNSQYTALQIDLQGYPADVYTSLSLAYYGEGTSCNLTWPSDNIPLFVSAWGFASDNITYSAEHAEATIGGDMTSSALLETIGGFLESISGLGLMIIAIALLAIVLRNERFALYYIAALATLFIGISLSSTNSGLGYTMMTLSAYEFLKGTELVFESGEPGRGWSRFKGIWGKIKGEF